MKCTQTLACAILLERPEVVVGGGIIWGDLSGLKFYQYPIDVIVYVTSRKYWLLFIFILLSVSRLISFCQLMTNVACFCQFQNERIKCVWNVESFK